jgi:hypothetical protein
MWDRNGPRPPLVDAIFALRPIILYCCASQLGRTCATAPIWSADFTDSLKILKDYYMICAGIYIPVKTTIQSL